MIEAIVTDIEGTTSSIDFVHKILFPYARQRVRSFLRAHAEDEQIQTLIFEIEQIVSTKLSIDAAADVLEQWIVEDRKLTPLKALQGLIWKVGYQNGELRGHVYPDTAVYLPRWHADGRRLYVYSSGSVEAQRLIFGHTEYGDLRPLFSGYFDTRIGAKREATSYFAILRELQLPGRAVLFLSDTGEELDAARAAGFQTCQLVRDEASRPAPAHPQAKDFGAVNV